MVVVSKTKQTFRKIQLPATLTLKKNGETVLYSHIRFKTKILPSLTRFQRNNGTFAWDSGSIIIYYDKFNDMTLKNEFNFTSIEEFKEKFTPCVEPALLEYLGDIA